VAPRKRFVLEWVSALRSFAGRQVAQSLP